MAFNTYNMNKCTPTKKNDGGVIVLEVLVSYRKYITH